MSLPPLTPYASLRWDVVRRLLPRERSRVLEVGCGQGAVGVRLAAGHDYTGVELDGESVEVARRRLADAGHDALRAAGVAPIGDWAERWAAAAPSVLAGVASRA